MTESAPHVHANRKQGACPLDDTHDRVNEAGYFLHMMASRYHSPSEFRYNANAFLSALKAASAILNIELQRLGKGRWYAENRATLRGDAILAKFSRGRDLVLHQRPLLKGSRIEAGLFRGCKLKMATSTHDVEHDRTTADILSEVVIPVNVGFLIDEEHSAIGEQLGVRRTYYVTELSDVEDVYSAALLAYGRMTRFVASAHEPFGLTSHGLSDDEIRRHNEIDRISLLLETDLDPEAAERWGW